MHLLRIRYKWNKLYINILLPPANEVWGKVIFLHLSVFLFTGGVPGQVHPPGQVYPPDRYLPWTGTPPGRSPPAGTPPCRWSMRWRYASYWNAFLFEQKLPSFCPLYASTVLYACSSNSIRKENNAGNAPRRIRAAPCRRQMSRILALGSTTQVARETMWPLDMPYQTWISVRSHFIMNI